MTASEQRQEQAAAAPVIPGVAHLVIDMQDFYCRPPADALQETVGTIHTDRAAAQIARIAPAFNRLGVPTYWIYMEQDPPVGPDLAFGGFYNYRPQESESAVIFSKVNPSAFHDGRLQESLRARGVRKLILSGFNFCACVKKTAIDAQALGYTVRIMMDCTADDLLCMPDNTLHQYRPRAMESYKRRGVILTDSDKVRQWLAELRPQA